MESPFNFQAGSVDGILGDDLFVAEFLDTVEAAFERQYQLSEIIPIVCERFQLTETEMCAPGKNRTASQIRGILALLTRQLEGISVEELGQFLGRHPSGLSRLATRLEKKCLESASLAAEIKELKDLILASKPQMSECQA